MDSSFRKCCELSDPILVEQKVQERLALGIRDELLLENPDLNRLKYNIMNIAYSLQPLVCAPYIAYFLKQCSHSPAKHIEDKLLTLMEACPRALDLADPHGNIAIHHAAYLNNLPRVIWERMLALAPHSPIRGNSYGHNCLHILLDSENISCDVLQMVLAACPDALTEATPTGKTPIYVLFTKQFDRSKLNSSFPKALKIILEVNPEVLFMEVTSEIIRVQLSNNSRGNDDDSTNLTRAAETWSPISKARQPGNERVNQVVECILVSLARKRISGGHPRISGPSHSHSQAAPFPSTHSSSFARNSSTQHRRPEAPSTTRNLLG